MHEGAGGVKRGQTELEKNLHHDKWRMGEGIMRGLRDIPWVQYEEYEASWDQEIQAKKCKGSINLYYGLLSLYGEINRKRGRYSTNFTPYPSYEGSTGGLDRSPTSAARTCQYCSGAEQSYLPS